VFPVGYALNFYIVFRRNSVSKGLMVWRKRKQRKEARNRGSILPDLVYLLLRTTDEGMKQSEGDSVEARKKNERKGEIKNIKKK
jgi:hypothetical protein